MNLRIPMVAALVVVVCVLAVAPGQAAAKTVPHLAQVSALVPARIWQQIGFVPMNGMETTVRPFRVRVGKDVYRGGWANALVSRRTLTEALKHTRMYIRTGNTGVVDGVFADRALTRSEKRSFEVLADFARDADVLVVKAGHPACDGLTLVEARSIASGRTTTWSTLGASPGGAADRIALRHTVRDGMYEARFGANTKPRAAKGRADGGVADAARDASVAAITSWSRFRPGGGVCAVPIEDVTPSDVTVHNLAYKGAFPVTFVAPKKRSRHPIPRKELAEYVRFLKSAAAAKLFRQNGLLMKADTPQAPAVGGPVTGGGEGPGRDSQGRPITTTRDDAAAHAALEGERLERSGAAPGSFRLAFEPGSILNIVENYEGEPPTCAMSSGRWTLVAGWRYAENGGGILAHVRFDFEQSSDAFIELPNEPPGVANYDGQQWTRSRAMAGSC